MCPTVPWNPSMHWCLDRLDPERRRRSFKRWQIKFPASRRRFRIEQDRNASDTRVEIFEKFHPFAAHRGLEIGEPGDVAARPCKTGDQAESNRIRNVHEYDRYCFCQLEDGG